MVVTRRPCHTNSNPDSCPSNVALARAWFATAFRIFHSLAPRLLLLLRDTFCHILDSCSAPRETNRFDRGRRQTICCTFCASPHGNCDRLVFHAGLRCMDPCLTFTPLATSIIFYILPLHLSPSFFLSLQTIFFHSQFLLILVRAHQSFLISSQNLEHFDKLNKRL